MVDTGDSLQEIIRRRQQTGFIGREPQLALFRDNLTLPTSSRKFVFAIHAMAASARHSSSPG